MDPIDRAAVLAALNEQIEQCDRALNSFDISMKDEYAVKVERASLVAFRETLKYIPSAQPETCEGCKHLDKWENEVEYGYPSPCTRCKRRVEDHYER